MNHWIVSLSGKTYNNKAFNKEVEMKPHPLGKEFSVNSCNQGPQSERKHRVVTRIQ